MNQEIAKAFALNAAAVRRTVCSRYFAAEPDPLVRKVLYDLYLAVLEAAGRGEFSAAVNLWDYDPQNAMEIRQVMDPILAFIQKDGFSVNYNKPWNVLTIGWKERKEKSDE